MSNLEDLTIKCRETGFHFNLNIDPGGMVEAHLCQKSWITEEMAMSVALPGIRCGSIQTALEWADDYLSRIANYERRY